MAIYPFVYSVTRRRLGVDDETVNSFLQRILDSFKHTLNLMEQNSFCSNSVREINERPLTAVSSDARDNTVLTFASLLTPVLDPYTPAR